MTARDHQRIGRLLGIPDCCIDAFNSQTQMSGNGVLRGPCRTPEECQAIRGIVSEWLGEDWDISDDPRRAHVPCRDCFLKVFLGQHPEGWVFAEDHDRICDVPHTQHPEGLLSYLWTLNTADKELSL